jgi:hypothetical protein
VDACDPATRSSFDAAAAFLKTADYGMLRRIRSNASFPTTASLPCGQYSRSTGSFRPTSTTRSGMTRWDWYFEIGDLASDRIVVREIFKAPAEAEVRAAIDPILIRLHTMASAFLGLRRSFHPQSTEAVA